MEKLQHFIDLYVNNKENIAEIVGILLALFAFIVRVTPTKSDDGFFSKVDYWVNKIFDFMKLPNPKKKVEIKDAPKP
jgi:hypothetical protein